MDRISEPFFIEFVGIPGCGKSTLSNRLAEKLRENEVVVHEPTYIISQKVSTYVRLLFKLPHAARGIIGNVNHSFSYLRNEEKANLKLLFNWLFSEGVLRKYSGKKGITIYDQGLIQALWSFKLSEPKAVADYFQSLIFTNYTYAKGMYVLVEADTEIVKERLKKRTINNSRVGIEDDAKFDLNDALNAYEEVKGNLRHLLKARSSLEMLCVRNENYPDLNLTIEHILKKIDISRQK